MKRIAAAAAVLACTGFNSAYAQQPLPDSPTSHLALPPDTAWERVLAQHTGESIAVLERGHGTPIECRLDYVTVTELACTPFPRSRPLWAPTPPEPRIVLPKLSVTTVWIDRQVQSVSWVPFAAAGTAIGICATFGAEADGARGAGNGALAGALVGLLVASVALISSPTVRHTQYRTHRVEIYQTQPARP
jgi:hypothetical protein